MDDELKTAPRSRAMMQRIRERLVAASQRLDEDVAQLATVAQRLDGDAGRLGGLVNDLLNTATLTESVTEVRAMEHDGG